MARSGHDNLALLAGTSPSWLLPRSARNPGRRRYLERPRSKRSSCSPPPWRTPFARAVHCSQRSPCSATSSPSFNARSPRRAWRGSTESSWSHSRPSPRRGETSCASPNPRPFFAGTVPASRLFGGGGVKRHPASRLATETATLIRAMASGTTVRSRRNPESVTEEGKGAQTRRHVAYTTRTDPICRSAATRRSRAPSNRRTRPKSSRFRASAASTTVTRGRRDRSALAFRHDNAPRQGERDRRTADGLGRAVHCDSPFS